MKYINDAEAPPTGGASATRKDRAMGKSVTVVVQGELGEELFRFEGMKNFELMRGVLVANELGDDSGTAGVVLKEGWSFYSHMEVDDAFKKDDWVAATGGGNPMQVLEILYRKDTGEAEYLCQEYYPDNGGKRRTTYHLESVLAAAEKPDYIAE